MNHLILALGLAALALLPSCGKSSDGNKSGGGGGVAINELSLAEKSGHPGKFNGDWSGRCELTGAIDSGDCTMEFDVEQTTANLSVRLTHKINGETTKGDWVRMAIKDGKLFEKQAEIGAVGSLGFQARRNKSLIVVRLKGQKRLAVELEGQSDGKPVLMKAELTR